MESVRFPGVRSIQTSTVAGSAFFSVNDEYFVPLEDLIRILIESLPEMSSHDFIVQEVLDAMHAKACESGFYTNSQHRNN